MSKMYGSLGTDKANKTVFDFDIFQHFGGFEPPHNRVVELVKKAPEVFWTPHNGGHWTICSYDAYFEAAHNPDIFSSNPPHMLEAPDLEPRKSSNAGGRRIPDLYPIMLDGDKHATYRAPLQKYLSPKKVSALTAQIKALANSIIEDCKKKQFFDGIGDLAEPFHMSFFLNFIGLPQTRFDEFRAILKSFKAPVRKASDILERQWLVIDAVQPELVERKSIPQEDLLSRLWQENLEGRLLSLEEMENYTVMLFTAGIDGVINSIGYGLQAIASDPDLQQKLRFNPKLINPTIEEILRRYSFITLVRTVKKDCEFLGEFMRRGELVMCFLPAINMDNKAFSKGFEFLPGRDINNHVAFGLGPHRCVGAHLARLELQILFQTLLEGPVLFAVDDIELPTYRGGFSIGVESLPLKWIY